jgi:hypothetical protein
MEMKLEEQDIELNKLDGCDYNFGLRVFERRKGEKLLEEFSLGSPKSKRFRKSYDAIIPLIQKQTSEVQQRIHNRLQKEIWCCELNPPIKYCEALLRATGKWKE